MLPDEPTGGYDVVYSRQVHPDLPGSDLSKLPRRHRSGWWEVLEELLRDPTAANPLVIDASDNPLFGPGGHMMETDEFLIIYRFLNRLVIELIFVGLQPAPPSTDDDSP